MLPYIHILGRDLSTYGLMTGIGIFFCYLLFRFTKKKRDNIDGNEVVLLALWGALGAFIGAHILFAVTQWHWFGVLFRNAEEIFSDFNLISQLLQTIFGGMVFYGGLIGAIVAAYIFLSVKKYDKRAYADVLAPCIPLFHAFGRIGCFLGGCCFGIESEFGFVYEHSLLEEANGVSRLPIQLIEAAVNILIMLLLIYLLKKPVKKGALIWIYGMVYPVCRFILEFWRGDENRGFWGPLSTSQWISIAIFIFSTIALIILYRKEEEVSLKE